jgi:transcriptional regulator with XRE-family HTH domain
MQQIFVEKSDILGYNKLEKSLGVLLLATLNERIKALRIEKELSQDDLAKILEVKNRSTLAGWESGRVAPDHEMIIKMANFFNVSTDYILGVTDNRYYVESVKTTLKDGTVLNGYLGLFDGLEPEDFQKVVKIIEGYKAKALAEKELNLDK